MAEVRTPKGGEHSPLCNPPNGASLALAPSFSRTVPETDERAARRSLRDQVARLEDELSGLFVSAWPRKYQEPSVPAKGGPRLLTLGQLEALRDDLAERLDEARRALAERTMVEEEHRVRIEEMLLDPAAHRWVRVSNADIGEPGCKHWHARPRGGIIGMFAGWWRVVISSGCPLVQGFGTTPNPSPTSGASTARIPGRARGRARCRRRRDDPRRPAGHGTPPRSSARRPR